MRSHFGKSSAGNRSKQSRRFANPDEGDYHLSLALLEIDEVNSTGGTVRKSSPLLTVQILVHLPAEPDSGVLDSGWVSAEVLPGSVAK